MTDPNTVRLGAGGSDKLQILGSGIKALSTMDMGNNNITNLANGGISSGSSDAVNGTQIFNVSQSVANALGGGSVVNANGTVSAPSYALTNANSIGGTAGAATTVASGFSKVDTALGTLNTAVTTAQTTANTANTTANKGWNLSADAGATSQNIAPGGTANFAAGTNATVTRSGNTITMGVVNNPTFSGMVNANGGLTVGIGKTVSMGGNTVTNVANGVNNNDAVSVAQLAPIVTALGNGAAIDGTTGVVTGPSYALTNANSIDGTVGAATDVGTGFAKVDAALGKVGTQATNTNRYFKSNGLNNGTDDAAASGTSSVAIGPNSKAMLVADIAIGAGAVANSVGGGSNPLNAAMAMGYNAQATTATSMALGVGAVATSTGGTALGRYAQATGTSGIAVGSRSLAQANNSVALGKGTLADRANTVSVGAASSFTDVSGTVQAAGTRQIVNMGAGTQSNDAVNVSQLTPVVTALGGGAAIDATTGAVTGPSYALTNANGIAGTTGAATDVGTGFAKVDAALGTLNTSVTQNTTNIAGNTTSINNLQNTVNNISSGTVGLVQQAAAGADLTVGKATDGVAVDFADKNGNTRTLKNVTAGVAATDAVNMSQLNATNANVAGNTTAITNLGTRVTTNEGSISTINTTIAGMNGQLADAVKYDSATHDQVTLGNAGTPVQVTNVKNGALTAASTDAVNGSQLYATNQQVAQNTTDIAGNTTAIAGNTTSISNITNQINNGTVGLVQQAAAGADLTVGKGTDGVAVNFADKNGNTRTLKNVTAGVANTDAVNMSQLNATNANVAGNTTAITDLGTRVTTNEGSITTINTTIAGMNGQLADAVKYDSAAHDTVTLGNAGTPVRVTNVKTGALSAASTDAVNGSQLYATNANVTQNTTDIAGNTTSITSLQNTVNNISGGTVGLVQQAAAGADLTVGKGTDGVAVDFADKTGNTRTLKNVTAGVANTDAVNMSQLNTTNANVAGNTTAITNLGTRVTTNEGSISTINTTIAGMNGQLADAVKYDSAAHDTVTLGNAGTPVQVTNVKNGALTAASTDAVNGSQLYATNQQVAQNTTDIAGNTTAIAGNTTSITSLQNTVNNISGGTVGLVQQAAAGADLTVGKDTDGTAVNFADKNGNTRTLKNVTAGVAATDAVNMSQLNTTNANVTRVEGKADQQGTTTASAFGGGASYNSTTGAIVAPSYTLHKADGTTTTANDVGTALTNVDGRVAQNTTDISGNTTSITSLQNTVNNISGGTVGLVQQAAAGADLTVGNATDGVAVDFADKTGNTRTLKNVTAGVANTDAVNMSQLNATNANVAGNTTAITDLGTRVTTNEGSITTINTTIAGMNGQLADAVKYDSAAHDTVTLGNAGTPVQVTNVKNGALTAASSDAVNGSQLYATNANVTQNTTDIAGNTTSITSLQNTVNNISGGTVGLVQQTAAGADLTVGKATDGVAVDFADKTGNTRTLKNVTAGVANTDAVNMSQLNATNANVAGNTTAITNLGTRVTTNEGSISTINTTIAGMNGQLADAVKYDSATHDQVTLGNAGTPVQVTNVKNGALTAASTDAVNGSQLYATNANVTQNTTDIAGNTTSITSLQNTVNNISGGTVGLVQQAVAGADLTVGKDTDGAAVNFADKNGNTRTLKSVSAGALTSASTDAVNGSQLYATNQQVTQNTSDIAGNTTAITNLGSRVTTNEGNINTINTTIAGMNGQLADAVKYDSATHDKVTLGTAGTPVQVTNVKNGGLSAASTDAVNGSQLYATNQQVGQNTTDIAGNTTAINTINTQINSGTIGLVQQASAGANLTVGKGTDGAAVDFQGTAGARKLLNVADGTVAAGSKDAVNGGQLHGVSQSMADAIGGGSTVNADGSISAPSYSVHNANGSTTTVNNVGSAITNLDGRVSQNTTDISTINTTITGMNGQLADAVKYDSAAHDKVTLGNAGTPVQVSNVKDGALSATSSDAVNGSQLYATNQQVAQNTGDIANINSTINTMNTGGLKYVQVNSTAAGASAAGSESVAVGGNTQASAARSVAIGNGAQASQANSVALGAGSVADRANSVSVGSVGQERQITNVAAGNLSATSTDAVNGSQLNATNQAVSNLDGRVTNVENTVNNMAGAVSNVTNITNGQAGMFQVSKDSNGTQPAASGSKSTAGGTSAVASGNNSTALGNAATASGDNSVALGANSVADRSNSVSVGSAGHERQVTNVAAGTANTDAVNVGQLKAAGVMNGDGTTNTAVTYDTNADGSTSVTLNGGGNATVIHNVGPGTAPSDAATVGQVQQAANWSKSYTDQQVNNMGRQVSGGVAAAMAMTSIPQAVAAGQNSVGAGVGTFRGQSSIAVGMSALSASGKFAVKFSASATTQGDAGVGVGASYIW
ncbi:hypothetical protein GCM10027021_12170 [Dyella kyungheensis]